MPGSIVLVISSLLRHISYNLKEVRFVFGSNNLKGGEVCFWLLQLKGGEVCLWLTVFRGFGP